MSVAEYFMMGRRDRQSAGLDGVTDGKYYAGTR